MPAVVMAAVAMAAAVMAAVVTSTVVMAVARAGRRSRHRQCREQGRSGDAKLACGHQEPPPCLASRAAA
jgi:hypothetical protein